jgi:hypothetical protein
MYQRYRSFGHRKIVIPRFGRPTTLNRDSGRAKIRTVTTENSVSAGLASDLRVAAVGAMAPFLGGLLVLLGYLWLGGFGLLIGIGAAIAWGVWWYRRNGRRFFPRDVANGPFYITVALTVVVFVLTLVSM